MNEIELALAELDLILGEIKDRDLVPSSELVNRLLDLRNIMDGYYIKEIA